jgi:Poly A polymerase head domain
MGAPAARQAVEPKDLDLPHRPIPRPGDCVVWYEGGPEPQQGDLLGSTLTGAALVERRSNGFPTEQPFASVRGIDTDKHDSPMWMSLTADGMICRPAPEEGERLSKLTANAVYPGPSHFELAHEIWTRGFEVFFTGRPVRDALTKDAGKDADLITTMPRNWLRILLESMYGKDLVKEETPQPYNGTFTIGETVGSVDPFAYVRFFRWTYEDDVYLYGDSFANEGSFTDFTFNAIYYDSHNNALIDPTSYGLEDAYNCCLRPMDWSGQLPRKDKQAIGFEILRHSLLGYTLCPGRELQLLTAVTEAGKLGEDTLCEALAAKVLTGIGAVSISGVLETIGGFLTSHGMADLFQQKIQPALKKIEAKGI